MVPEDVVFRYPELDATVPSLVTEAMKIYGVYEFPGGADNPIILGWAKELSDYGYGRFLDYKHDAEPWCALGMSIMAHRAGYLLPTAAGWSQAWKKWGTEVEGDEPGDLGDIAVFVRDDPSGVLPRGSLGHVAVVIRSEPEWLHCIGCNQSDAVNIRKLSRANCVAVRRPPIMVGVT